MRLVRRLVPLLCLIAGCGFVQKPHANDPLLRGGRARRSRATQRRRSRTPQQTSNRPVRAHFLLLGNGSERDRAVIVPGVDPLPVRRERDAVTGVLDGVRKLRLLRVEVPTP